MAHAQFALESSQGADESIIHFLNDAQDSLPESIKQGINKKIHIEFQDLVVKDKVVWGQVAAVPFMKERANTIILNQKLLSNIRTGENYNLAKATLLHEISHIFDFQNKLVGFEKELNIKNKDYTISDSPVFFNVTGWKKKSITRRMNQTNTMKSRRVDLYEDKSPQETFAVNVEHFLMDPEFKCRKPGMYDYLSKSLDHSPFENTECEQEYRLAPTITVDGNVEKQKVLDPKRLYEVHYFFAGQGKNIMSRWGHAMIRLVMCAPTRTEVSEKCLQDRAHHLILSFRADVTNFNIDYIKGMTGKYSSKMFVLSMADVIKEYNVGELRDLYSIPLKMDEEQKNRLVSQVLERYWGYESKYYFITNNCADETLNLLKNVYPDEMKMVDMKVLTPLSLKKKFEQSGISDMSVFNDLELAKKTGYFFEGLNPKLQRVFSDLIDQGVLTEKDRDHEKFLNESTLEERQAIAKNVTDSAVFGKLVFIEDTIVNRKMIAMQKKIASELDHEERSEVGGKLLNLYRVMQDARVRKSGLDLKRGYGIPQKSDEIFGTPNFSVEDEGKLKEAQKDFADELKIKFTNDQEILIGSMTHKSNLLIELVKNKK